MSTHKLIFDSENAQDVVFRCTACGKFISFNKPGIGEPSAIPLPGGGWTHPADPERWLGPCEPQ